MDTKPFRELIEAVKEMGPWNVAGRGAIAAAEQALTREDQIRIRAAEDVEWTGTCPTCGTRAEALRLADELSARALQVAEEYGAGLDTCPGCMAHLWQKENHRDGCWLEPVTDKAREYRKARGTI